MLEYAELAKIMNNSDVSLSTILEETNLSRNLHSKWSNGTGNISLKSYAKLVIFLELENKLNLKDLYTEEEMLNYYMIKRDKTVESIVKEVNIATSSAKRILHEKNTPGLSAFLKIADCLNICRADRERYIKFMYGIDINILNLTYIKAKLDFNTNSICEKLGVQPKHVRSIEAGKSSIKKYINMHDLKNLVSNDVELTELVNKVIEKGEYKLGC